MARGVVAVHKDFAVLGTKVNAVNLNRALIEALRTPGRRSGNVDRVDDLVVFISLTGKLYSISGTRYERGSSHSGKSSYRFKVDVRDQEAMRTFMSSGLLRDPLMTLRVGDRISSIFPATITIAELIRLTGSVHSVKSQSALTRLLKQTEGFELIDLGERLKAQARDAEERRERMRGPSHDDSWTTIPRYVTAREAREERLMHMEDWRP